MGGKGQLEHRYNIWDLIKYVSRLSPSSFSRLWRQTARQNYEPLWPNLFGRIGQTCSAIFAEHVRPYLPNMFGRICRKCSAVFAESVRPYLPNVHHITSACDIRVHRAGSLFPRDLLPQVIIQHFTCLNKDMFTIPSLIRH